MPPAPQEDQLATRPFVDEARREARRGRGLWPSVVALVAAHLWPLAGVLFYEWTVFAVVFLFWLENVVVGLFNIARMALARGAHATPDRKRETIPFFALHYGVFALAHGIVVLAVFGGGSLSAVGQSVRDAHVLGAGLVLAASHGVSLIVNYLGAGEYRTATLDILMFQPYGRVVVLHMLVIFGAIAVMSIGAPMEPLALLVTLKLALDLTAHVKEHTGAGGLLLSGRRS